MSSSRAGRGVMLGGGEGNPPERNANISHREGERTQGKQGEGVSRDTELSSPTGG